MKHGLRTFPLPVDLDDSVKLVEAEFGIEGFAVVIKLHQAIYARGYYMKWDIDTELLFMRDYCLSAVGRSLLSEIVSCCIRRGVFESTMFEKYRILTSRRIQETFLTATKRNTEVVFNKDYALDVVYTFIQNADKNGKNVNIFFKNADSLYAECDKRKENKIKEKNLNESNQFFNPLLSAKKNVEQCYICDGFNIDFDNDPFFKPYANADSILRQSLNSWLVKNHKNQMVDKNFICQQITNFAKRQGKWGDLLGIPKNLQLGNNNSNIKGDEKK